MNTRPAHPISILCVDDNTELTEALRGTLARLGGFEWLGSLSDTTTLRAMITRLKPNIVLLDVDMPGRSSFDLLSELGPIFPGTRIVFFSGHVRAELIDRALDGGAWGYASKSDTPNAVVQCLRDVAAGNLGFTPESRQLLSE